LTNDATGSGADGNPLAALYRQFPGWEAWRGVGGMLYARRRKSTPPIVFRAVTVEELAAKIRDYEAAGRSDGGPRR
jgi:hypothetical protein